MNIQLNWINLSNDEFFSIKLLFTLKYSDEATYAQHLQSYYH